MDMITSDNLVKVVRRDGVGLMHLLTLRGSRVHLRDEGLFSAFFLASVFISQPPHTTPSTYSPKEHTDICKKNRDCQTNLSYTTCSFFKPCKGDHLQHLPRDKMETYIIFAVADWLEASSTPTNSGGRGLHKDLNNRRQESWEPPHSLPTTLL